MRQTLQVSVDFRDEVDELHDFLQALKPEVLLDSYAELGGVVSRLIGCMSRS